MRQQYYNNRILLYVLFHNDSNENKYPEWNFPKPWNAFNSFSTMIFQPTFGMNLNLSEEPFHRMEFPQSTKNAKKNYSFGILKNGKNLFTKIVLEWIPTMRYYCAQRKPSETTVSNSTGE